MDLRNLKKDMSLFSGELTGFIIRSGTIFTNTRTVVNIIILAKLIHDFHEVRYLDGQII